MQALLEDEPLITKWKLKTLASLNFHVFSSLTDYVTIVKNVGWPQLAIMFFLTRTPCNNNRERQWTTES